GLIVIESNRRHIDVSGRRVPLRSLSTLSPGVDGRLFYLMMSKRNLALAHVIPMEPFDGGRSTIPFGHVLDAFPMRNMSHPKVHNAGADGTSLSWSCLTRRAMSKIQTVRS